ncbi:transporter [Flavobacterium restrictum]|uniref:Transporter n=1 Tax=Flavobacterium restrictum TaxID=2594428 RepID=A0A553E4A7_9FLAO|nr:transporter [Flavobacterium restrictum]TRX39791.1 transporter [Flavobacterium restrictum]
MKKNSIYLALLCTQLSFGHAKKEPTNRFSFQKMALELEEDCDACGCSASGGSMGFSSMLNSNFVGLRYFNQSYSSRDGIFANSPWVNENFNTIQIWSKIPITEKLQISTLIPYQFHNRERSTGTENIQGLGDITVMGMYSVFQTHKDSTVFVHKLQLGGGIKIPTGKFDEANNSGSVNKSFQVGTGSWDYLLATEYVIKKSQLGVSTMLNYTLKTKNKKQYQFGNQFNYGSTLFYLFDLPTIKIVPQAGIAGEIYKSNSQYGEQLPETAGDILFSKFGLEIGITNFSLGINTMLPINQHLSNSKIEANYRWSINLNYSL